MLDFLQRKSEKPAPPPPDGAQTTNLSSPQQENATPPIQQTLSDPGHAAYQAFCYNQAVNLIQAARGMKVTCLLAMSQNELSPAVRLKLFEECMAICALVEIKAETT